MTESTLVAELYNNLKFDDTMVDTTLGKQYLKKHNSEFRSPTFKSSNDHLNDGFRNKIWASADVEDIQTNVVVEAKKFIKLAEKVKENAQLFAQLNYLIREVPVEDTLKYDTAMISNCFLHHGTYAMISNQYRKLLLQFTHDSPLAVLGFSVEQLVNGQPVIIEACANTAVISFLFTNLCYEAGFIKSDIQVHFNSQTVHVTHHHLSLPTAKFIGRARKRDAIMGSVVAITEKADVNSAIESILAATHNPQYPWRLRRVVVQESVYDQFKIIIESKRGMEKTELLKAESAYKYNGKTIAFDFAGDIDCAVLVEAYRNTAELLSLLKRYDPNYLSLWCSDTTVSNEIAFSVDSLHVWINDFGVFDVPSDKASSYYKGYAFDKDMLKTSNNTICNDSVVKKAVCDAIEKVVKARNTWCKRSIDERIDIIKKVIDKCKSTCDASGKLFSMLTKLYNILHWNNDSFATVRDGSLIVGMNDPVGIIYISHVEDLIPHFPEMINSIVNGNGIVMSKQFSEVIDVFGKEGVPIFCDGNERDSSAAIVARRHENVDMVIEESDFKLGYRYTTLFKPKIVYYM